MDKIIDRAMSRYADALLEFPGIPLDMIPDGKGGVNVLYDGENVTHHFTGETVHPDFCCPKCRKDPCRYKDNRVMMDRTGQGFAEEGLTNRQVRYRLYRAMARVFGGEPVSGKRVELPACVESYIKSCYPNEDGEEYVGFQG